MKRVIIRLIITSYYLSNLVLSYFVSSIYAEDEEKVYQLPPIVVTPYKSPVSLYNSNRSVYTIQRSELEDRSFYSIPKLLFHTPGVDIRRKGVFGVQSDLSIRGANFAENLVLIDGIRLTDPQTAHHNMDIPLTINDIERIEVVKGHTSSVYGPGGFGGALNIITKKPKDAGFKGGLSFGENDFFGSTASVTFPVFALNNRLSFENKKSSGWRDYSAFDITTLSYHSSADFQDSNINFNFGWKDNDFEAGCFYHNRLPRTEEHTDTRFFKIDAGFQSYQFRIEPKLYYRRHADKYIPDKEKRGQNENFHASYLYGTELLMHMDSYFGRYTLGVEVVKDKVESTNLGYHSHQREAVLLMASPKLTERLNSNLGLRYDHFYKWGNVWTPSVDIGYQVRKSLRFRSSVGKSFRTPSFTELYYRSSSNIGDETLEPEEAWSYEVGFSFEEKGAKIECDVFRRETEDAIDWTRSSPTDPSWRAQNIGEVDTDGLEVSVSFAPVELKKDYLLKLISFSYSHLDSDRKGTGDFNSKYVLNFLRHHANMRLECGLPFGFESFVNLSYKDRVGHDGHFLLDIRLYKDLSYKKSKFRFFIDAANLLNTFYTEIDSVPPPGRWIITGFEMEF